MRIGDTWYRTIWPSENGLAVEIIDQTLLPHVLEIRQLRSIEDAAEAIRMMRVRGAPLIGATAAYGLALALREDDSIGVLEASCEVLTATRPTAVNLRWALDVMAREVVPRPEGERANAAWACAARICDDDVEISKRIGEHGLVELQKIAENKGGACVNILTHCNAGWLATVDWGTALAPIYMAHDSGLKVHVWVDETRPRNQGAALTAWELSSHGVPHDVIVDNAGGHLMQHGLVDLVITGTDRTTRRGDVCNKIGTYLKALAAHDNGVPFYVCLPSPTIDWSLADGVREIPIEERDGSEVSHLTGATPNGEVITVRVTPEGAAVANYAFDVTPRGLVTGLITERGVVAADAEAMAAAFPDHAKR